MWFWIWTVLVVAALVALFFVLRLLWRKFRDIFAAATRFAEESSDMLATSSERTEVRLAQQPSTAPTISADPVDLLLRVEKLRDERLLRRAVRRRPRPVIYRRWLSIYR